MLGLLAVILSGCSLWGTGKWSAFSVTLVVQGPSGEPLKGALVSTISQENLATDKRGKVTLFYDTKGLYVITVSVDGMETTQVKVTMPNDSGREIPVIMTANNSPTASSLFSN